MINTYTITYKIISTTGIILQRGKIWCYQKKNKKNVAAQHT